MSGVVELPTETVEELVRFWNLFQPTGSPNHCHQKPGKWDGDKRHKKGSKCHECELHDKVREALRQAKA